MVDAKKEELGKKSMEKLVFWFRRDTFFDGFRNTPARILITTLSAFVLYGGLILCWAGYNNFDYIVALLVVLAMQAISVRFVFQINGKDILDEYQEKRRDRAYRRAYQNIRRIMVLLVLAWVAYTYIREHMDVELGGWEILSFQRALTISIFLIGLVSLQKYLAFGIKGEPFVSREESQKLRNS